MQFGERLWVCPAGKTPPHGENPVIVDLDPDGLSDILSTNGFNQSWVGEQTYLWKNMGGLVFEEDAIPSGLEHRFQGRGAISLDYDNDGDMDIAIFASRGPFSLYRNNLVSPGEPTPPDANWIRVDLDTSARDSLAPAGIGSLVTAVTAQGSFIDSVDAATSHCSSGQVGAHFGLAGSLTIDALRVRWNDGSFTTLVDVPANQILLVEAPFSPADFDGDGSLSVGDAVAFITAFSDASLTADQNGDWILDFLDVLRFIEDYNTDS
jgi:hypothetical protein